MIPFLSSLFHGKFFSKGLLRLFLLLVFCLPFSAEAIPKHALPNFAVPSQRGINDPAAKLEKKSSPVRRGFFEKLFRPGKNVVVEAESGKKIILDSRMREAARLAERSARSRPLNRCWRFVKRALQKAKVVDCYPKTALAKQAAVELPQNHGFKKIDVKNPHDAPVGAVLVYGGRGAGHVEFRTETGFVSDHASRKPSRRPLIGVFVKALEG